MERPGDTDLRKRVEEAMTRAAMRTCPGCRTPITKIEGCNKITCPRCGSLMCYICRQEIPKTVAYKHFCQHGGGGAARGRRTLDWGRAFVGCRQPHRPLFVARASLCPLARLP